MTKERKQLVERIGIYYERSGMQPVASRILGLLLVSEETELTFDAIREELNVSKSATSNALNLLLRLGNIEYITKPGDRKRYFKSALEHWTDAMQDRVNDMLSFNKLLVQVKEIRTGENKDFENKLDEVINFMEYLGKELPLLIENWKNKK